MLRAGLPVLNTLEMLEKQTTAKGMKIIETIKKDLVLKRIIKMF